MKKLLVSILVRHDSYMVDAQEGVWKSVSFAPTKLHVYNQPAKPTSYTFEKCGVPHLRTVESHVGNFPLPQPTSVRSSQVAYTRPAPVKKMGSLKFVGNFTHPPNITQDQLSALLNSKKVPISGCAASCSVATTQKTLHNPTMPHDSDGGICETHSCPGHHQRYTELTHICR